MSNAPYSAATWQDIRACGDSVEASLQRSRVLLTMGGEPTFVPLAPSGAEWQTAALGPTKLAYARKLARELVRSAFPGAVILETSGKHYPGEPLPRWALLIQRLADGTPLWRDITRLRADIGSGAHKLSQARAFVANLASALSLATTTSLPFAETADPDTITGYVLPLDRVASASVRNLAAAS